MNFDKEKKMKQEESNRDENLLNTLRGNFSVKEEGTNSSELLLFPNK